MKIALVNLQSIFLMDPMVYPPLGLWYLAAQLEAKGHQCDFFDLNEDELPADGYFDQLWVSCTSSQLHALRLLDQRIKDWTKTSKVIGGVAVWGDPNCVREMNFNVVASGEADHPDIIDKIIAEAEKHSLNKVLHIGVQKGINHILPPVRRWSHRYHAHAENYPEKKLTTIFTTRGCPYACAFCDSGRNGLVWNQRVRFEPLDLVEKQLDEIVDLGYSAIYFYDDIMPLNKIRTLKIAEMLSKRNIIWRVFLRSDIICNHDGYNYLKVLHDCGLVEACVGIESADNQIKKRIHKGTTIEQDTKVLKWCKDIGIIFKASIILGLPGETQATMQKTRLWLLENKPDLCQVLHLIPFPGTPIARNLKEYGLKLELDIPEANWYTGNGIPQVSISTEDLNANELQAFGEQLRCELKDAGLRLERV